MKKVIALAAVLLAAACSPQIYPLFLEVRQPSASGLDLSRKSMSIVYVQESDSLFDRGAASSLARSLEADYFGGQEVVGLYSIPAADSVSLALMHDLVMDTDGDVVFLLSSQLGTFSPETNQAVPGASKLDSAFVCPVLVTVQTRLSVYDSMGAEDAVKAFKGSAVLRVLVYNDGQLDEDTLREQTLRSIGPQAEEMGERIARRFLSGWKTESFSFYYYDAESWHKPLDNFAEGKFSEAIDGWAPLAKSRDVLKRACEAYKIAQAFYLTEEYEWSSRWLEIAERTENLSLSAGLRKRLNEHLENLPK